MQLKIFPSFLMLLFSVISFSQEATEIYLFDIVQNGDEFIITNPINISNNPGAYDNQPSFTEDGSSILFTSLRDGQTDIAHYDIGLNFRAWLTQTTENEYSPESYPDKKKFFTCVRQEKNGTQLLYKYSYKNKEPEVLIPNLIVGYYAWFSKDMLVTFVISDTESLLVNNFKYQIRYPIQQNIGRSFQKIPGSDLLAFISKDHESPEIYSINPQNTTSKYIVDAVEGSEDMVWTKDKSILMGKGNKIFRFSPKTDKEWKEITIESDLPVMNITRMSINPAGNKIAIVVSEEASTSSDQ